MNDCSVCKWASFGGPPCYYHSTKFGIGKLTTTIASVAVAMVEEAEETYKEIAEELSGAIEDELNEKI